MLFPVILPELCSLHQFAWIYEFLSFDRDVWESNDGITEDDICNYSFDRDIGEKDSVHLMGKKSMYVDLMLFQVYLSS